MPPARRLSHRPHLILPRRTAPRSCRGTYPQSAHRTVVPAMLMSKNDTGILSRRRSIGSNRFAAKCIPHRPRKGDIGTAVASAPCLLRLPVDEAVGSVCVLLTRRTVRRLRGAGPLFIIVNHGQGRQPRASYGRQHQDQGPDARPVQPCLTPERTGTGAVRNLWAFRPERKVAGRRGTGAGRVARRSGPCLPAFRPWSRRSGQETRTGRG